MFYSSLILTKKGPLAKVWLAAHWGDKKLNRPQIFATDITASVDTIVNPPVPLALRMSGHLLLGVVRIYSRKVKYLMQDAHEAMLKINSAFYNSNNNSGNSNKNTSNAGGGGGGGDAAAEAAAAGINMEPRSGRQSEGALNVSGFGEYNQEASSFPVFRTAGGFQIPFDLNDDEYNAEDWIPAQLQEDDDDEAQEDDDEDEDAQDQDLDDSQMGGEDGMLGSPKSRRSKGKDKHQQEQSLDGSSPVGAMENFTLEEAWDPTEQGPEAAKGKGNNNQDEDEDAPIWDPSDDEEEEQQQQAGSGNKKKKSGGGDENESLVSDIEAPRDAANASMSTAADQNITQQSDLLMTGAAAKVGDDGDDGMPPPDDEDDFNMTMDDDDEHQLQQQHDASSVNRSGISGMSVSHDESGIGAAGLNEDVDGEEEDDDDDPQSPANQRKRKRAARAKGKARAKKRRRRNVEIDTRVRMTQREYHAWIKDTSDIVRPFVHPAAFSEADREAFEQRQQQGSSSLQSSNEDLLMVHLRLETLYTRPTMGDDGQLAPALLRLFGRHMGHVAGHDFPYELEEEEKEDGNANEETAAAGPDGDQDEEMQQQDEDEVEGLRDGKKSAADLSHNDEDDGFPPPDDGDDEQQHQQQQDDEDFVAPMNDDDEEQNLLTQPQEEAEDDKANSEEEEGSTFSLGLVNDVLGDSMADEDDPRQLAGDELVSSNSKWHAHTIKVYNMLVAAMAVPGSEAAGGKEGAPTKPSKLSFEGLSKNCSRRTAAGVFFELLQLKTWDYIDVDQNESFGNIIITPGPKFGEAVPSN